MTSPYSNFEKKLLLADLWYYLKDNDEVDSKSKTKSDTNKSHVDALSAIDKVGSFYML